MRAPVAPRRRRSVRSRRNCRCLPAQRFGSFGPKRRVDKAPASWALALILGFVETSAAASARSAFCRASVSLIGGNGWAASWLTSSATDARCRFRRRLRNARPYEASHRTRGTVLGPSGERLLPSGIVTTASILPSPANGHGTSHHRRYIDDRIVAVSDRNGSAHGHHGEGSRRRVIVVRQEIDGNRARPHPVCLFSTTGDQRVVR